MNRKVWLGVLLALAMGWNTSAATGQSRKEIININADLQIRRIADHIYMYTEWADMEKWGRVGCNGLVVTNGRKGFLIDSPTTPEQTASLSQWLENTLRVKLKGFVPGHWHADCTGGLEWLNGQGVRTYAGERTNKILAEKGLPVAKQTFADSLVIRLGKTRIACYYLGGGHATDNIVVWIPAEKVLFGGCMIKDTESAAIGNTSDAAPLSEWLNTVEKTENRFPQARIIVPGHGEQGGKELFRHTKEILKAN